MATRTNSSIQALEAKAEEIAQELETLESQLKDARSQIARAEKRFAELEERRTVLAPKAFSGDADAQLELEGLEDEHDQLARSVRVAKSAAPEFERMIEEVQARLDHAQAQVHRANYERLLEEKSKLEEQAESILDKYLQKQLELKALRPRVVTEGRASGLQLTPDVVSVAEQLFEKARAWEVRQ